MLEEMKSKKCLNVAFLIWTYFNQATEWHKPGVLSKFVF